LLIPRRSRKSVEEGITELKSIFTEGYEPEADNEESKVNPE
jgi:hypothetical protein